ncbi:MAG: hypothetical protein AAF206_02910 [Bacteroidota bacterium]
MFRHSICEPLNPEIIEKGAIEERDIISTFQQHPWKDFLLQMERAQDSDIQYSPSLEFENQTTGMGITVSAVGRPEAYRFYIFFKRPKVQKKLFGLVKKLKEDHIDECIEQSEEEVIACLQALMMEDVDFLEQKFSA